MLENRRLPVGTSFGVDAEVQYILVLALACTPQTFYTVAMRKTYIIPANADAAALVK